MLNRSGLITFLFVFLVQLAHGIENQKESLFNCNSKFSAEACFELGEHYLDQKQFQLSTDYFKKACLLKHEDACNKIKPIKETKVETKGEMDPSFKVFMDNFDKQKCNYSRLDPKYTIKDQSSDKSVDYCFNNPMIRGLYAQCSFTEKNLKKIKETSIDFPSFIKNISQYNDMGVCIEITPEEN